MQARKRGRPPGVRSSPDDLDILRQVYIWMNWPQYRMRSFDLLVHYAEMAHWSTTGGRPRAADRTALPNDSSLGWMGDGSYPMSPAARAVLIK
jgi:hypothetical protein